MSDDCTEVFLVVYYKRNRRVPAKIRQYTRII